MKLTCAQMDVLISFYIDGDLSSTLKAQVEEHIKNCATCRAKYDIIKSMLVELKNNLNIKDNDSTINSDEKYSTQVTSQQYRLFKNNISAYVDNELSDEENLKIKKFAINNSSARKDLESSFNIRRLLNDSYKKTKAEAKYDFSKNVLKQLELEEEATSGIHPAIKLIITFTIIVLIAASFVLTSLSV